jgi:hypothetical protein
LELKIEWKVMFGRSHALRQCKYLKEFAFDATG